MLARNTILNFINNVSYVLIKHRKIEGRLEIEKR